MKRIAVMICFLSALLPIALAADVPSSRDLQNLVNAEFGEQFVLLQTFPFLTGDFNGDGSEDAVFVATSRDGLQLDSDRFRVIDPSSEYFGEGDPKITSQFAAPYPGGSRYLLIIHGSGKEGWRAKEPSARFVVINMTFDRLSVGHLAKKKKVFDDINFEETGSMSSFLYWNGRRYKWQPGATQM
jgi:hypothetical protein